MIHGLTRRSILAAGAAGLARPVLAQDGGTVIQENEGTGVAWLPIISAFYVKPYGGDIVERAGEDGPPEFPPDEINPPLRFSLFPSPIDAAPTIDTDWAVLQKRMQNGECASAWMLGRDAGRPRIYAHRVFDEEYLAGYSVSERVQVKMRFSVLRESFALDKSLRGPARNAFVRDNVKVAAGEVRIGLLNGVKPSGLGGTLEDGSENIHAFRNDTLASLDKMNHVDFIPRRPTEEKGGLLDGVVQVKVSVELEAGPELKLDPPQRKKLSGELRIGVGKTYVDFMLLNSEKWKK